MRTLPLLALAAAPLAAPAAPPAAEEAEPCPWCAEAPEAAAALGVVSHGPFPVARTTSDALAGDLPGNPWMFLETEHLRIASNLDAARLKTRDLARLEDELARLRAAFPALGEKPKKLDPWLRLHLFALRCEDFYARFQELLDVTDADFPAERRHDAPFMGDGLYLGEKDKFELVLHARRATHELFTRDAMGVSVTDALRWHFSPEHKLVASIPVEDPDLDSGGYLFSHAAHLMSHLFLCAYKHFSYDPPIWLDEGLAHVLEREIEPDSTTIDGDEGSGPHRGGHRDWSRDEARVARSRKQVPFAELMRVRTFHDLDEEAHVKCWSLVRFLATEHPGGLARLIAGIKGQLDERGYPSGADLPGLQRTLLQEIWGWSPADLDQAWKDWVLGAE